MRFLLFLLIVVRPLVGADRIQELIEKGPIITRKVLDAELSLHDVPDRWKTKIEYESTENTTVKTFFRGKDKVLSVLWGKKDSDGPNARMFSATVYDGQKRICRIIGSPNGSATFQQPKDARLTHSMVTTVNEAGAVSITFYGDNGYHQSIELRGRETRLLDDLEYTKNSVTYQALGGRMP